MYSKDGFVICILFSWEVHLIKSLKSQSLWPKVWNRWGHVIQDITRPLHGAHYQDVGSSIAGISPHVHQVKRWHNSPSHFSLACPLRCRRHVSYSTVMAFARQKLPCATRPRPSEATGRAKWADSSRKWPIFCGVFMFFVKHPWFWAITKPGKLRSKSHLIILDFLYFMKIHKLQWYLRTKSPTTMAMDLGKQVSKTRSPRFRFHVVDVLMPMNRPQGRIDVFLRFNKKLKRFLFGYFGTVSMCRWTISEEISGSFGLGQQWWFLIL